MSKLEEKEHKTTTTTTTTTTKPTTTTTTTTTNNNNNNNNNNKKEISLLLELKPITYEEEIIRVIETALREDLSDRGDITTLSTIDNKRISHAYLLAKADGVISGINIAIKVFQLVDQDIEVTNWKVKDGDVVRPGEKLCEIRGKSQSLLTAERTVLNIMQRMSGIATQTRAMVEQIASVKSKTVLLDTRKTAPGLRILDKLAVAHGGGKNHRMGLYDMVMIKDNHIAASGGIEKAIDKCLSYLKNHEKLKTEKIAIEIECGTLEQVQTVCSYGKGKVHRIMLDNMVKRIDQKGTVDTTMLEKALQIINGQFETEASGNITLETVAQVAKTNVDFVSTGSVTHSVQALDISLKFID